MRLRVLAASAGLPGKTGFQMVNTGAIRRRGEKRAKKDYSALLWICARRGKMHEVFLRKLPRDENEEILVFTRK
jgi:hypothetical protein